MRGKIASIFVIFWMVLTVPVETLFFDEVTSGSDGLVEIKDSPYIFLPNATSAQVLLDADENFYLFHITNGDLYYRKYDGLHKLVKNDALLFSDGKNRQLHIELDSYDHIHMVWSTDCYGGLSVMYMKMDLDGNEVVSPIKISENNTYMDRSPKVGPNSKGQAFIYWEQKWSSAWYAQDAIYAMVDSDGSILVPPTYVAPSNWDTESNLKDLLVDQNDSLHVVYQLDDRYGHEERIYYKRIGSDGTTVLVDNKQLIDDVFYYWHGQVRLLLDSKNRINFAYSWGDKQGSNASVEVWWAKLDLNGNVLIGPSSITPIDGMHSMNAYLVNDKNESNYILWDDERDGNFEVYYAVLDSEGNLLKNQTRITNTSADTHVNFTSAVIDPNGECYWVYYERDGAYAVYPTAPMADAGGPYKGSEGSSLVLDATFSYDENGNELFFRWDFDADGSWDTGWSKSSSITYTWGDDFLGHLMVEASDGSYSDTAMANVSIENVAPSLLNLSYELVEGLKEKGRTIGYWKHQCRGPIHGEHTGMLDEYVEYVANESMVFSWVKSKEDVCKVLEEVDHSNMTEKAKQQLMALHLNVAAGFLRVNSSIDFPELTSSKTVGEAIAEIEDIIVFSTIKDELERAKNLADAINNEGAVSFSQVTFDATARDEGSDDITFEWDFGDGNVCGPTAYFNDGIGPDPYPSIKGTFPFYTEDSCIHTYAHAGDYTVTLTISDDDGGLTEVLLTISL